MSTTGTLEDTVTKTAEMIAADIQARIDELVRAAERLRAALGALGVYRESEPTDEQVDEYLRGVAEDEAEQDRLIGLEILPPSDVTGAILWALSRRSPATAGDVIAVLEWTNERKASTQAILSNLVKAGTVVKAKRGYTLRVLTARESILSTLKSSKELMTAAKLASVTGINRNTVSWALRELVEEGEICNPPGRRGYKYNYGDHPTTKEDFRESRRG